MVRLNVDLIARGTSGYTKKKRDESIQHYLKRLTHLYLEDRNIDEVGEDLGLCRNLTVLYLYDNRLTKMPNLNFNSNLTHLYLQNNSIDKIDHLSGLRRLSKLYLGGNCITVLEGFEKLDHLQELHMENQKLPAGEKLLFDPMSIAALSRCVQVLNVSGNNLDSIRDLEPLVRLQQLLASDNQLCDMKELAHCLSAWSEAWRLELIGNPLCHKSKYRDRVIIMASKLEMLDGKEITTTNKQFIQRWQENKEAQKRKRHHVLTQHPQWSGFVTAEDNGDSDLPPVSAQPRHAAIPGYMMPALPRKQFQDVLARSGSHPGSAVPNKGHGHDPGRTFSDITPPKYLNTYGTIFHDPKTGTRVRFKSAILNPTGEYVQPGVTREQTI